VKRLTKLQEMAAEVLWQGTGWGRYHFSLSTYKLTECLYGEGRSQRDAPNRWDKNPRGRAFLMGNVQRSMARRPDVFVVFVAHGSGSTMASLTKEAVATRKGV